MVVMRLLGVFYFHHKDALRWQRARSRDGGSPGGCEWRILAEIGLRLNVARHSSSSSSQGLAGQLLEGVLLVMSLPHQPVELLDDLLVILLREVCQERRRTR